MSPGTEPAAIVRRPQPAALTRAIFWMGLALISFSAIAISGREAGRTLSTAELIFWRSVLGAALIAVIYWWQDRSLQGIRTSAMGLHMGRAVVHYAAQYAWLYALTLIPLAQLFALEFTTPLWVAILAPFILGEHLTRWRIAAAALGFLGALLLVEPGLLRGHLEMTASPGTLFAAASAVGFASSMIFTKRLTRTDPALRILFWMQVLQGLIAAAMLIAVSVKSGRGPSSWTGAIPLDVWAWVAVLGIAGLSAHFALTRAFGLADAIIVAPMDFLRLPLIAAVGAAFYGETMQATAALGASVVVLANGLNMWSERRMAARLEKV